MVLPLPKWLLVKEALAQCWKDQATERCHRLDSLVLVTKDITEGASSPRPTDLARGEMLMPFRWRYQQKSDTREAKHSGLHFQGIWQRYWWLSWTSTTAAKASHLKAGDLFSQRPDHPIFGQRPDDPIPSILAFNLYNSCFLVIVHQIHSFLV